MSRKKKDFKREILPDGRYGDLVVAKTINGLMDHGKKGVAERAIYEALDILAQKASSRGEAKADGQKAEVDPLELFHRALNNIKPMVEVRSRRVGGATYQVPTEVRAERAQALAIRWLVDAANQRTERGIASKVGMELLDALNGRGNAMKKREDVHRMAEANKAFAHFRW
jgi:small subunit ribosomal protein S7